MLGQNLENLNRQLRSVGECPVGTKMHHNFPDSKGTSGSAGNSLKVNVGRCRHSSRDGYDIRMSRVRPVQAV